MKDSKLTVYGYDWVPDFAKGHVRDFRVRWALKEAGFAYDVAHVPQGSQGEAAHLKRQPFAQVPVLDVDGMPMFESGAIVWRIAEQSPALLPEGIDRDRAFSWVIGALNSVEPPVMSLVTLQFFVKDKEAGAKVAPDFEKMVATRLRQIAGALDGKDWMLGRFTVADLLLAAVLRNLQGRPVLAECPEVEAYVARALARPACREAIADQTAEIEANAPKYQAAG